MYLHIPRGRSITLTALLFGSALHLSAQTPKKTDPLPEVVITATKTETERWRTASSITVIDRKEIEDKQFRMLPDALSQVPGLVMTDNGSPGTLAGVFMRGNRTQQTAFLVNGRPIPANAAGSFNPESMGLDNIERIEVLRGPAASLYGGKTIGGVINIITRTGKGLAKPEHSLFFEAGSYGTFREGAASRGAIGAFDWSIDLTRSDIQGQRINSQFQHSAASGTFGYQAAESLRFDLDWRFYNAEVGVPGANVGFGGNDPNDHLLTEFWSISPRLVWQPNDQWTHTLSYQFGNFRQVAQNFAFTPNNRITSRNHFWEYQTVFKATEKWELTFGASVQDLSFSRFNNVLRRYDIDQAETNWAAFVQSKVELLPGWNIITGLRHDSYSDFSDATTWRAASSWQIPGIQTVLHGNYGTAFSPPTIQDREPALFGTTLLTQPERSQGYEFGIEQPIPAANARIAATWFHNDLTDTFEFVGGRTRPVGKARREGLEVSAGWQPCECFGFNASYTYLESDNLSQGTRLVRQPRHMITAAFTLRPHDKVTLSLSGSYVIDREDFDAVTFARRDAEDYMLARLTANWQVHPRLDLFARIENLFGDNYEVVSGFPAFDTGAYAGFKLRF
jgi:vitamin B12 transporter